MADRTLNPVVEAEEEVYRYAPADNGAGPLWCYGSSCLARLGDEVFLAGLDTLPDAVPLCNCRWVLHRRTAAGWERAREDKRDRTREPSPIAVFRDGRLFLSVNPSIADPDAYSGQAEPRVLRFSAGDLAAPYATLLPQWEEAVAFTEHSYRGLAADGDAGELLLMNIFYYDRTYWSFLDRDGRWSACGKLMFPWGAEYEQPQPVRLCYPNIALKDRAVHVMAVSDIIEPVRAWRQAKREITGIEWDYEFRRLFYCRTPDITREPFGEWTEIASRERTCGHISNLDLWVAPDGAVHLLWIERSVDVRIRDRFFPGEKLVVTLVRGIVRDGELERREDLLRFQEGSGGEMPLWARLHTTADGRLTAVYTSVRDNDEAVRERFYHGLGDAPEGLSSGVMALLPGGGCGRPARLDVARPLTNFMTATVRAGSAPSDTLDMMGTHGREPSIRYVRVAL